MDKLSSMLTLPLRLMRADALTAAVMRIVVPHLCKHVEGNTSKEVFRALHHLFYASGVEIISDADRQAAGLPLRGETGLTAGELLVLEQQHLEQIMRPLHPLSHNDMDAAFAAIRADERRKVIEECAGLCHDLGTRELDRLRVDALVDAGPIATRLTAFEEAERAIRAYAERMEGEDSDG